MEGAKWNNDELQLTPEPSNKLALTQLRWIKKAGLDAVEAVDNQVPLPVYLNSDRSDLLFTIFVAANSNEKAMISQRAVAVITSF
ncbi:hypothetical protein BC938DRAFT_478412 [Jimgerdemannia flammicorona]|uniref:Dynein heavy chain C-terminal domain-containing protein n=1 Tax=Jimgerdemannia flammicorona TaxID=994334 RepID=A0A433P5Q0_9FUNG|nr:hypothetical protein BC938DRAFT_478412 [Jimgerdemannia flammicorona]